MLTTLNGSANRLARVLRLNAMSCLGFGVLFAIAPNQVGQWLGTVPAIWLQVIGAGLVLNCIHLLAAAGRRHPLVPEIVWFSAGDLLWWLASVGSVAAGWGITTTRGILATLGVATFVASLGIVQLFKLGKTTSRLSATEHLRRIGRSWLALPTWVKWWLFALNAVFLAAPLVWPWNSAKVVLLAYAASGPLLFAFVVWSGGLTRSMGVGHLLPWTPLLFWLASVPLPSAGYAVLLAAMVVICLAFDVYDLVRWWRGDRAILGALRT
jgi:hypothetical protein